jgi:hypothetical protein
MKRVERVKKVEGGNVGKGESFLIPPLKGGRGMLKLLVQDAGCMLFRSSSPMIDAPEHR